MALLDFLRLPDAVALESLDDLETTLRHRRIIHGKKFLKSLYCDLYAIFEQACPAEQFKNRVELGSGGGFLKDVMPQVKTSDVLFVPGLDLNFSALEMPFCKGRIDAFLMIDVFHHVKNAEVFLRQMSLSLRRGGKIVMIEPANTCWGRFIFSHFHHEPFLPKEGWTLPESGGPLSCANIALPWIVFVRDRALFQTKFPEYRIVQITAHTPFSYLASGGVSMKQLVPTSCFRLLRAAEWLLQPFSRWLGMFYTIEIEKV